MSRRDDCDTSDTALADEIASNRDAGLSHLCAMLSKALADTAPTPAKLNLRHPDFASFAVRIGRACGRENEMVAALKAAENDKHTFLLENDSIAVALLAHLSESKSFTGPAKDLREHLIAIDGELAEKLSAKRLGKRLNAILPHLKAALAVASSEQDRKGFCIFTFKRHETETDNASHAAQS
jgi:hypothetical protein